MLVKWPRNLAPSVLNVQGTSSEYHVIRLASCWPVGELMSAPASLAVMVQSPLGTAAVQPLARTSTQPSDWHDAARSDSPTISMASLKLLQAALSCGETVAALAPHRFATRPRAAAAQATEAAPALRQSVLWPDQLLGFSELGIPDRTT